MLKNFIKTIPQASHGHGQTEGVEQDKPASFFIAVMSVVLLVMLAVIWFVFEGLLWTASTNVEREFLEKGDVKHAEMRSSEEALLHQYDVADKEKGFYQIPIDQAMDKLAQQGSLDVR